MSQHIETLNKLIDECLELAERFDLPEHETAQLIIFVLKMQFGEFND